MFLIWRFLLDVVTPLAFSCLKLLLILLFFVQCYYSSCYSLLAWSCYSSCCSLFDATTLLVVPCRMLLLLACSTLLLLSLFSACSTLLFLTCLTLIFLLLLFAWCCYSFCYSLFDVVALLAIACLLLAHSMLQFFLLLLLLFFVCSTLSFFLQH